MPKSRNRKNHKKKVTSYKNQIIEKRNESKKSYIQMMEKQQQDLIQKKIKDQTESSENIVDTTDMNIDDMNIDDMNIDDMNIDDLIIENSDKEEKQ